MRWVTAGTLALVLACSAVAATAQSREGKPARNTSGETDRSPVGTRTVTGTVKETTDKALVVVGRETGKKDQDKKDQEWAFVVDANTRIGAGGRTQGASDLRQGDPVTVTYTTRDGKIVAQSVSVNPR
jgi:hypothetical protein